MVEHSLELIREVAANKPLHWFYCFFFGGRDSLVATHLTHRATDRAEVVFVNTTIGAEETLQYVEDTCQEFGWRLHIIRPEQTYDELVARWGFPHWFKYRWCMRVLKVRPIEKFLKEHKPAIEVIGIRRSESLRRLIIYQCVKEFHAKKGRLLLAPLLRWDERERDRYIRDHKLPVNPLARIFNFSCDCFCMAWPKASTLRKLRVYLPDIYARLSRLEQVVLRNKGGYPLVKGLPMEELNRQQLLDAYICPCTPEVIPH